MTLRATGRARPELVWQRYVQVDRWASWSPQIRAVRCVGRRLAPGLSGTVESVPGVRVAFLVEAVDHEQRTWTWRVRWGPVRLRLHHAVRPHPRGSATSLTMTGPWAALPAYAPPALLALRRLVRP
ncbi:SRPBCC family protein [Streptomyces sp. LP11]|uniref:SRPBCC family protein n=1 Tax=Streptomyces pyxinicus TaxID=2970331 RepID=A0ABT2B2W0_9ACTN|nr:SRPBCC family protein [Streptomyces sp. LP11]